MVKKIVLDVAEGCAVADCNILKKLSNLHVSRHLGLVLSSVPQSVRYGHVSPHANQRLHGLRGNAKTSARGTAKMDRVHAEISAKHCLAMLSCMNSHPCHLTKLSVLRKTSFGNAICSVMVTMQRATYTSISAHPCIEPCTPVGKDASQLQSL